MSAIFEELQAFATAGGPRILWRARLDGNGVKVACACGRRDWAFPMWVNARAWPVDQLAGAIDDAAAMAVGYWSWQTRSHGPALP